MYLKIKHKYYFAIVLFFVLTFIFLCFCMKLKNESKYSCFIKIKGSDTIVNLMQELSEEFMNRYQHFNISISGGGSGVGFMSLVNKMCDITMSSRKIDKKETVLAKNKNIYPYKFKIGLDGVAIIVNKNNCINKLTIEQLKNIFTERIINWKELGWENKKIIVLSRESNSGTYMLFKKHVLGDDNEFGVKSLIMPSSQAIYNEVSKNPNAIGYVGIGFLNKSVKAVSISTKDDRYIYPELKNIMNHSYPMLRPLYLYTNGKPDDNIKEFIDYILSENGQKIILKTGFVPIKSIINKKCEK
ncbi:MAG: phosphate ABC transporter substrate-binding protein [Endomicrobium sp.]|nr:phosphate ABC transporter substrate-binding protein [Endomicrobium sp.]